MILENYQNQQYHTMLFVGSNKTPINFHLNTGSHQSWFVPPPTYKSDSLKLTDEIAKFEYDHPTGAFARGKPATDSFAFHNVDTQLKDIDFLSASTKEGLDLKGA